MKFEDYYSHCADFIGIAYPINGKDSWSDKEYLIEVIEDLLEAKIIDREKAEKEFLNLLDSWHEKGLMKPI